MESLPVVGPYAAAPPTETRWGDLSRPRFAGASAAGRKRSLGANRPSARPKVTALQPRQERLATSRRAVRSTDAGQRVAGWPHAGGIRQARNGTGGMGAFRARAGPEMVSAGE